MVNTGTQADGGGGGPNFFSASLIFVFVSLVVSHSVNCGKSLRTSDIYILIHHAVRELSDLPQISLQRMTLSSNMEMQTFPQ